MAIIAIIWLEFLKGINSGTGSRNVAEPNVWPKSIGIMSQSVLLSKKFPRCRSPMPNTSVATLIVAKEPHNFTTKS